MKTRKTSEKQLIHKLFLNILLVMSMVSVFNVVGNIIYGFPMLINLKWIIFLSLTLATYYYTRERLIMLWKFLYFTVMIYIMMPISFIDSGGSNNNTIGYLFIITICVSFFFWGWQRYFLVTSTVVIFNILLMIENKMPQVIKVYADETQMLDRMVQISLLVFLAFLFLKTFSDAYSRDKTRLDEIVHIDSLTGLNNRRSFDAFLKEALSGHQVEYDFLVFIDIDHFKEINDSKGHHFGDMMIQSTGKFLKTIFAESGIVARWGGDEFAVVFKGNEQDLVTHISELIENNDVPVSCGFAEIHQGLSAEILLQHADHALYESKNKGRNQWHKYRG